MDEFMVKEHLLLTSIDKEKTLTLSLTLKITLAKVTEIGATPFSLKWSYKIHYPRIINLFEGDSFYFYHPRINRF